MSEILYQMSAILQNIPNEVENTGAPIGPKISAEEIAENNRIKQLLRDAIQQYKKMHMEAPDPSIYLDKKDFALLQERDSRIRNRAIMNIATRIKQSIEVTIAANKLVQNRANLQAAPPPLEHGGVAPVPAAAGVGPNEIDRDSDVAADAYDVDDTDDAAPDADPDVVDANGYDADDEASETGPAGKMMHAFNAHRNVAANLAALSTVDIEAYGQPISLEEYSENTAKIAEEIRKEMNESEDYEGVVVDLDDAGSLILEIPRLDGRDPDVLVRSYENNHAKVTLSNPPDDLSIFLMLKTNSDILPLTMTRSCGEEVAMRLFEASVISGREIVLTPADHQKLLASPQYADRYQYLLNIQQQDNEEHLQNFRKRAQDTKGWKLGQEDLSDLQVKIPPANLEFGGPSR